MQVTHERLQDAKTGKIQRGRHGSARVARLLAVFVSILVSGHVNCPCAAAITRYVPSDLAGPEGRNVMAKRNRLVLLAWAALALANGGCLAVAAGAAAAGAGAAGYAYLKGRYYRDYPASLDDAFAGIRTALTELQFPLDHEEKTNGKGMIESRTSDGTDIHIEFETLLSRVPAEGQVTRVYIRIGTFGDELVSARIFDQADLHFVPPGRASPR